MADSGYGEHIDSRSSDIKEMVEDMRCQPILLIGSGISQRYFDAPTWKGLLKKMADQCPEVREIEYYLQRDDSYQEIGSTLAEAYYEWAWDKNCDKFPDRLYDEEKYEKDIYLKYAVSEHFSEITPDSLEKVDSHHQQELELLQEIQPHSIITTNYDQFLEVIYPDYEPILGEEVLRSPHQSIGEIYKIHGCTSAPQDLVLTEDDYRNFNQRKKYLSAKLLTYFAEHPVLIAGYSIEDKNMRRLLSDIDEILSPEGEKINNIYFLEWDDKIQKREHFEHEKRFPTIEDRSILLNYAVANGFEWVFKAFASGGSIEGVNLKMLRTVMANTYDIVAQKAPRKEVNVNYKSLKRAAESEDALGTVFGVSIMDDPPDLNIFYRYRLSEVAEELGYNTWHDAHYLIEQIEDEKGVNIKDSDNVYHLDIAFDSEYPQHRYSEAAIELLSKVDSGQEYELDVSGADIDLEENTVEVEAD